MTRNFIAIVVALLMFALVPGKSRAIPVQIDETEYAFFIFDVPSWDRTIATRYDFTVSNCDYVAGKPCASLATLVPHPDGFLQILGIGSLRASGNTTYIGASNLSSALSRYYPDYQDLESIVVRVWAGSGANVDITSVTMGFVGNSNLSIPSPFDVRTEVYNRNNVPRELAVIPLPPSAPLFAAGLLGLALLRHRKLRLVSPISISSG